MSTLNIEESVDSEWKVLVGATQKASLLEGLQPTRSKRHIKSYEQFLTESTQINSQKSKHYYDKNNNIDIDFAEIGKQNDDVNILGDWVNDDEDGVIGGDESSETEKHEYQDIKPKRDKSATSYFLRKLEPIREENNNDDCSSNYSDSIEKERATNLHAYSQDESTWESISSGSEDDNSFDEFLKLSKYKTSPTKHNDDFNQYDMGYTNLTDCVFKQYYSESVSTHKNCDDHQCQFVRQRKQGFDYQKEFTRNGQLALEERLPLMEVLDALDDINKVLKVGKVTPRMERILEYKQDYPFMEGYQEETLGWCPWLVYKVERLCKKLSAKQWPY